MSQKEGIPSDIWDAALAALGYRRDPRSQSAAIHVRNVARAILAERGRCANIADAWAAKLLDPEDQRYAPAAIASAIRGDT